MKHDTLRNFIAHLEQIGELKRINTKVNTYLEITEISDRVLRAEGPALLFENVAIGDKPSSMPVLTNLFGTTRRVALGMGRESVSALRGVGTLLANLKEPEPPKSIRELWEKRQMLRQALAMPPKTVRRAPCQEVVMSGDEVDLTTLPIQHCWPGDAAPLLTWGLTITRGTERKRQNVGIYRQQLIGKNKLIMRWLAHRGGALDYADFRRHHPDEPFPVVVAIGADPATILAAVTPIPDTLSEYQFAGLLRGSRTALVKCLTCDLNVPANAEIILEGHINPGETALEGPYADHTGYYNEQAHFPVFTVTKITRRKDAIYHSTYTGKPPDEPAILGMALNEVFIPLLQKQFPEIVDFYLPPEGCSYRLACISIKKQYPGHAKRVMFGLWSVLRQFMYTKFVIIVDEDINIRDWKEVIWAITTRTDAARDTLIVENTPIDYLDFASPVAGLGSKMGIDATNKWPGETQREWGRMISMDESVKRRVDALWDSLEL